MPVAYYLTLSPTHFLIQQTHLTLKRLVLPLDKQYNMSRIKKPNSIVIHANVSVQCNKKPNSNYLSTEVDYQGKESLKINLDFLSTSYNIPAQH